MVYAGTLSYYAQMIAKGKLTAQKNEEKYGSLKTEKRNYNA